MWASEHVSCYQLIRLQLQAGTLCAPPQKRAMQAMYSEAAGGCLQAVSLYSGSPWLITRKHLCIKGPANPLLEGWQHRLACRPTLPQHVECVVQTAGHSQFRLLLLTSRFRIGIDDHAAGSSPDSTMPV